MKKGFNNLKNLFTKSKGEDKSVLSEQGDKWNIFQWFKSEAKPSNKLNRLNSISQLEEGYIDESNRKK